MGGYGNNGYIPQINQINPQPIPPLHREHMQPHYQPQMQPHQMQPHPNQHPHLQQMQQHSMPNMMPAYNNPPQETRTLDRNMVALERNFDRALTIDRSIMFDPRMQMVNDRHPMLPGQFFYVYFLISYFLNSYFLISYESFTYIPARLAKINSSF